MFNFKTPQRVCSIGNIRIGGQPGENPPLLISSMFHNGDKILESRKERKFNKKKATDYVKRQEELSELSGIPAIVAMVATSADEMKAYVDFFTSISDKPFGIDMWVQKARLEAMRYIAELGLQDRVLYNSITPWDKDIPGQIQELKDMGVKHVVVQVFDEGDQTPAGRVKSFRKMMEMIGEDTFETILIDTSVMNLPAIGFSALACKMLKEEFGWPAGVAASNGTWMWKQAREIFGSDGFKAMDGAGQAVGALLWSDFMFTGPIVAMPRIVPAVTSASLILSTLAYQERKELPSNPNHPLYKFFNDFADKLRGSSAS
ncbi:tetrahydromethanopterin S-methyltransferase subunit H family protein [Calderihabitans maritimus]|uniref:Tetrahydromethanopterin S-methyltransferase n=1 Tax=Calderihabitans maritimus TaxID=1246530 RepID=A0A1Z5HNG5_9FIRM|nr:tetrahydromethanopterin S-methyltransferase subunit H [Calderihabitans maritimus]GAW91054.1 Tetrahydromethanopterin S-methyltransferase [Calderihabitans maritimus]